MDNNDHTYEKIDVGGRPAVVLRSGVLRVVVLLPGMKVSSVSHGGTELLGDPSIDGIGLAPIEVLFPWANRLGGFRYAACGGDVVIPRIPRLRVLDELPIHGVDLASTTWRCAPFRLPDQAWVTGSLRFSEHADLREVFPFDGCLRVRIGVKGAELRVDTYVDALGEEPVPISFGWHPFLRLPGPRAQWGADFPIRRRVDPDERTRLPKDPPSTTAVWPRRGLRQPWGDLELDDLYPAREGARFTLAAAHHELALTLVRGYPYAQVWSPPGRSYICVEPMTAMTDALRRSATPFARPGRPYAAAWTLSVRTT
jgi:aldose 1-epimerase